MQKMEEVWGGMETFQVTSDLLEEGKKTFQSLQKVLKSEEEHWRLTSKSLWLQDGDRNSKFFHRQAKARIWRNKVSKITNENGVEVSDFYQIKEFVVGHFEKLYKKDNNVDLDSFENMLNAIPTLI